MTYALISLLLAFMPVAGVPASIPPSIPPASVVTEETAPLTYVGTYINGI